MAIKPPCPSKFRPPKVLGYRSGDLNHEEIQQRENLQSSTGDGRQYHGPGFLQETPDHRTEFLSLADQIRQHDGIEVRRLQEHDNAQLRQIVVNLTLDNRLLRDVNQKKC